MKIGAHVETVGVGLPYEVAFPMLKKLGAEGVELVIREGGLLSLASTDADFLRVKALAEQEGLAITGATSGYSWSLPMTSDSLQTRRRGEDAMRRVIEATALLGADALLVVPGYAQTSFVSPSEVIPVDTALQRAAVGMAIAAAFAASTGVSLNVEVVWGGMLRTPKDMRTFIEDINSPAVGFHMDTGNVYPEGDPVGWIDTLAPYIRRVHMKDFSYHISGLEAFCPLGEGDVPFDAVIRKLKAIGYDGWIGSEHHCNRSEAGGGHSLRYLQNLLATSAQPAKGGC